MIVDLVSWDAYFPAPYGLETRPISSTSPIFGIPFFLALVLNIAAIPILWRRPKVGSLLTLVLGTAFIFGILLDQAGLVVPGVAPPLVVTVFQVEGAALSVLLLVLGSLTYRQTNPRRPGPTR